VATKAILYVDPGCPWCFQTSRWARRLEELGIVELSWGFFPLEVLNSDVQELDLEQHFRSVPSMRVALLIREELGQAAAGNFYNAIAGRQHHRDEQLKRPEIMLSALAEVGIDESYLDRALADEGTAVRLMEEYRSIAGSTVGVPTFVLDGPGGPSMFGPVIVHMPDDHAAIELWQHFEWFVRNDNVFEIKTVRTALPDLDGIRLAQQRRAARAAAVGPS
jgi:hypothetical protein